MPDQDLHELMLNYLLDNLNPDERESVDRRLDAGEADWLAALAETSDLLAALPAALDPVLPDGAALGRLMTRVQGPASDEQSSQTAPTASAPAVSHPKPSAPKPPRQYTQQPVMQLGHWPKLAIAAAFVLGVGLTAVVLYSILSQPPATQTPGGDWADLDTIVKQQREQLAQQEQQLADMQTALAQVQEGPGIEELQQKIDGQRLAIAQQQQRMSELQESMSLLVGPGVQQTELAGGEDIPNAQGRLMWDPVTGQMRLLTRGLAALQPGETYELWFVTDDGEPVSLGVFEVGQATETTASYVTTVPGVPSNVNVAAISIEPTGGSQQAGPSGPIIMTGEAP